MGRLQFDVHTRARGRQQGEAQDSGSTDKTDPNNDEPPIQDQMEAEFNFDDSLFSPPGHSKGPLTRAQRKENSLRCREIGCVEPEVLDVTAQEAPGQ